MRPRAATLLLALALALPRPAASGELAVEAQLGIFDMAARDSATAVFGSSGGAAFGGAVRYSLWRGAFVSAGLRSVSREGERVFVTSPQSAIHGLGFPVTVELRPALLSAGYRFRHGQRIVPYASLGAAITSFRETSTVAGESFDDARSKTGFVGAAGVELGSGRIRVGAELGYSSVPGVVGLSGVSEVYGEDDIGGFHVVGKLVLAFGL